MQEGFSFASSLTKGREEQTSFCQTAFNMGRCYTSLPTRLSKHTASLAGRALAHLALGLTGAGVGVKLRKEVMMQQNEHTTWDVLRFSKSSCWELAMKPRRCKKPLQRGSRSPLLLRLGG